MQSRRPAVEKCPALLNGKIDSRLKSRLFIVLQRGKDFVNFLRNTGSADLTEIYQSIIVGDGDDAGNDPRGHP